MSAWLGRAGLAALATVVLLVPGVRASSGSAAVRLAPCPFAREWLCGQIRVPVDRAKPEGATIPVAFYVLEHHGAGRARPVFVTPGGPGDSGWAAHEFYEGTALAAHRDIVIVDPRGTGRSAPIDCPDLQNGWHGPAQLEVAETACAHSLGEDADRYGSGDVAMDVDAVRRALGYRSIDYYAFSYGSVDQQAYAARFPTHLHALAIDAGMPVTDPAHAWTWSLDVARALPRIATLLCKRERCGGDVRAAIDYLDAQVRDHPVSGDLGALHVVVGEPELINLLRFGGNQSRMLDPKTILELARGLRQGDPTPLLDVAVLNPRCCDDNGDPRVFSQGDNIAAFCNDADFVWNRSDATVVRMWKYRVAVDQLPKDAAAPFSVAGWNTFNETDLCLYWPPPTRFVPAVPPGAALAKVPAIIFSGDVDAVVPTEITRTLLAEFPHATFVTVAGASHPAIGWRAGCVAGIALHFFDTLRAGNTRCAANASVGR